MTNWEKNKKIVGDWGILPVDNVPKNVLDYLKNTQFLNNYAKFTE